MATKKKSSPKKKAVKKLAAPVSRTKTPAEHLQILIDLSLRACDGLGGGIDQVFTQQANRLKAELEKLKESK